MISGMSTNQRNNGNVENSSSGEGFNEAFDPLGDRNAEQNQRVFSLANRLIETHDILTAGMKEYRMKPHPASQETATSCAAGYAYIIQDFANVIAQAVYSGSPSAALALLKPLFEAFLKMGALVANPTFQWNEVERLSRDYPKVNAKHFHGLEVPFGLPTRMYAWVRTMENMVNQFSHARPALLNGIAPVQGSHAPRYKVAAMEFTLGFAASCLIGAYEVFRILQDGTSVERALSTVNTENPLGLQRLKGAQPGDDVDLD